MADIRLDRDGVFPLGDKEIAILIPGRYGERSPIKGDLREQAATDIRKELSELAGGASGRDERLARIERLAGSFKDDDGYIVDEPIIRIYAKVGESFLSDDDNKRRFVQLAKGLCGGLQQQSIGAEWGGFLYFVSGKEAGGLQRPDFREIRPDLQRDYIFVTLRRVRSVRDVAYLLFLNRWMKVDSPEENRTLGLLPLCRKDKRTAWVAEQPLDAVERRAIAQHLRAQTEKQGPRDGDLIFAGAAGEEPHLQVWMCQRDELRGGRRLFLVDEQGQIRRSSYELARSLLNAAGADDLSEVIDRERLTDYFFREYHRLRSETAAILEKSGLSSAEAEREAQLLLGRLMFLRFLERKGVLEKQADYLRRSYGTRRGNFYTTILDSLFFDVLDVPVDSRTTASPLPFLNGGLFRPPKRRSLELPDELFDPDRAGSILEVFYRFEFTLDEAAGVGKEVSVDPSMFGRVLESLYGDKQRKTQGVHYTPETIASTLAFESIIVRLAERSQLDLESLRRFARGEDENALSEDAAERLLGSGKQGDNLFSLRILDPAVGSGSLLLAALDVLLNLFRRCKGRLGEQVEPGKRVWSQAARRFVRECLFGVDIDQDAIEVARLRLWLSLAIADDQVRPLPDLGYNIRLGDSLSRLSDPDAEKVAEGGLVLDWGPVEKAGNTFYSALKAYRRSEGIEARTAAEAMESAERDLLIARLQAEGDDGKRSQLSKIRAGEPLPFLWQVHFHDVFSGANKGFDVIITNPPYVRVQNLPQDTLKDYKTRFASMKLRNRDIYLAFVEQALRLAGRNGRIAFIMPNFARTQAALGLRRLLAQRGAVELWVDFTDVQVFSTATNYVALLFARARRARSRSFPCRVISEVYWRDASEDWLRDAPDGMVSYGDKWGHLTRDGKEAAFQEADEEAEATDANGSREVSCPGIWRTNSDAANRRLVRIEKDAVSLGSLAEVTIGVQTSKDDVFLLREEKGQTGGKCSLISAYLGKRVLIDCCWLKRCAKGSEHLKPYRIVGDPVWCLWPYDASGELVPETSMKKAGSAWQYLKACEKELRNREKGKFDDDRWYRFRRPQGIQVSSRPNKIIVPSMMSPATAYLDREGGVCFTASGTGGGGAWGVELFDEKQVTNLWLLAVLNSRALWEWLTSEGDRKKGGWRGVDQGILRRVPVPVPKPGMQDRASVLVENILDSPSNEPVPDAAVEELDRLVWAAYGLEPGTRK